MPGVFNLSIDEAVKEAEACAALGIGGLLLFGLPEAKDEQGTGAYADDGIVQQGAARDEGEPRAGLAGADRRCVPVRVHLARTLRHRVARRGGTAATLRHRERCDASRCWRRRRCRWPRRARTSLRRAT